MWTALTDPAELEQWSPFNSSRDLGVTGEATLAMADVGGATGEAMQAVVRRAEPPRLLEYTWGTDLLRWELEPTTGGTRLTLYHTLGDRSWVPKIAAGWHICPDVAEQLMNGTPVGRIVSEDAKQHGWERLNDEYAAILGIESTSREHAGQRSKKGA